MTDKPRVSEDDLKIFCDGTMDWKVVFNSGLEDDNGRITVLANQVFCDLRDARETITTLGERIAELEEERNALIDSYNQKHKRLVNTERQYNALRAAVRIVKQYDPVHAEKGTPERESKNGFAVALDNLYSLLTPEPANEGGGEKCVAETGVTAETPNVAGYDDRPAALAGQRVLRCADEMWWQVVNGEDVIVSLGHPLYPICRHYEQTHGPVEPGEYVSLKCKTCDGLTIDISEPYTPPCTDCHDGLTFEKAEE